MRNTKDRIGTALAVLEWLSTQPVDQNRAPYNHVIKLFTLDIERFLAEAEVDEEFFNDLWEGLSLAQVLIGELLDHHSEELEAPGDVPTPRQRLLVCLSDCQARFEQTIIETRRIRRTLKRKQFRAA
jgi:hypothetical protein